VYISGFELATFRSVRKKFAARRHCPRVAEKKASSTTRRRVVRDACFHITIQFMTDFMEELLIGNNATRRGSWGELAIARRSTADLLALARRRKIPRAIVRCAQCACARTIVHTFRDLREAYREKAICNFILNKYHVFIGIHANMIDAWFYAHCFHLDRAKRSNDLRLTSLAQRHIFETRRK